MSVAPARARSLAGPAIHRVLPHRFPFLMVDRNVEFAIEIIGQLGIALFNLTHERERPANILLGSVSGVTYLGAIPLGCTVHARAEVTKAVDGVFLLRGAAQVQGREILRIDTVVVTEHRSDC